MASGTREQPVDPTPRSEPVLPATPTDEPSLEIPEVLRTPVRQSQMPGTPKLPGGGSISGLGVGFAMAFDFVGSVGAGALLGYLFDRWQGTSPTGTLVGLGVGFVGAMIRIVRASQKADRADRKRKR